MGAVLVIDQDLLLIAAQFLLIFGEQSEDRTVLNVDHVVLTCAFHLEHFEDIQGIEHHFLYDFEPLVCQAVFVDVHVAMVVFVELGRDRHLRHFDHEDKPVSVCEILCNLQALPSLHEAEHLDENSRFQRLKVPLAQFGFLIKGLLWNFTIVFLQILFIEVFNGVVVLIEGEDAGAELLSRLHGLEHRVEDPVVEGLLHIKANDLPSLCLLNPLHFVTHLLIQGNIFLFPGLIPILLLD